MKPTKCPEKEKKRGKKSEKGGEERKLSAHARASQANILRLDQRATKCTTWLEISSYKSG